MTYAQRPCRGLRACWGFTNKQAQDGGEAATNAPVRHSDMCAPSGIVAFRMLPCVEPPRVPTWPVICRVVLPRRVLWLLVALAVASAARFLLELPLFMLAVIVEQICNRVAAGAHQGHEQAWAIGGAACMDTCCGRQRKEESIHAFRVVEVWQKYMPLICVAASNTASAGAMPSAMMWECAGCFRQPGPTRCAGIPSDSAAQRAGAAADDIPDQQLS